ncbi:MAG: DapH/DapD/GlmU-related protein [Acidiphilium sp.]|nr:DapH/DapD/GlmU-related protein [Acidiphilium sp.]MDD4936473.1 DapH/DapD/GlmU-related protein [Acidiphilium sp.]
MQYCLGAGRALNAEPSVDPSADVQDVRLGRFCEIGPQCRIAESSLGDYTYVGAHSEVIYADIGKFCSIAAMARINPGNHPLERAALHHFTYRASKYGFGADDAEFFAWRRRHAVVIGHDVWIGHGAIILPGRSIGDGAVVGAGAVVTRDIEDFAIVVGVPAKPLRFRFSETIRAQLKLIGWWNWTEAQLAAALNDFRVLPIEAFCERYASDGT